MAQVAFLLLTHRDPEGVIRQAERLTAAGDMVALHFDGRAPAADWARIRAALAGNPAVALVERRIRCGWGEWSLVEATLATLRRALAAFPEASHFYLLSGDCMPIKTVEYLHALLEADPADHIESVDFQGSGWIQTGIREERLIYRHYFNERRHKRLFDMSLALQSRLGLARRPPADLQMMIGSQWWCLRRTTATALLAFVAARPDVVRFFHTTWIPDETFFQTLVRHLVPAPEIRSRPPTFVLFTDYGMPVVFCNDHHDLLIAQGHLFARKISPDAAALRAGLDALCRARGVAVRASDEGRAVFRFLTSRGRVGLRFAPRAWEEGAQIGRDRVLHVLLCKKWHLAKRLSAQIRAATQIPAEGYLFDEDGGLPDLGGIERHVAKRNRHRKALLRMLFDYHQTSRLLICSDPAALERLRDFAADAAELRVLELGCAFSEADLAAHARRRGRIRPHQPEAVLDQVLPALRADLRQESARLSDAGFAQFFRIPAQAAPAEAAQILARFLDIAPELALGIVHKDHLFSD